MEVNRKFLNVEQVANYLGFSKSAIRKWIRTSQIPYCRVNSGIRFDIVKIDEWIGNNSENIMGN